MDVNPRIPSIFNLSFLCAEFLRGFAYGWAALILFSVTIFVLSNTLYIVKMVELFMKKIELINSDLH